MLSNACKYAIRSILYLASESTEENKLGGKKIAEELHVPAPFLAKLLRQLASNQIISSSKGPTGGFYLNEDNLKKTVWDIILAVDGSLKFDQCFLGLPSCSDLHPCPAHHMVSPFKKEFMREFRDKSLAQLTQEFKNGKSKIVL